LRRDESDVLREALQFEVDRRRGRGPPRNAWKKQVEKEIQKCWFEKRGCTRSSKMERKCPDDSCEKHPATSIDGDKTRLKLESSSKVVLSTEATRRASNPSTVTVM